MSKVKALRSGGLLAVVVASAVVVGTAPAYADPVPSGQADALTVVVSLLNNVIPTTKIGPLAQSTTAGPTSNQIASATVPGIVSAGVGTTHATQDPVTGAVHSDAKIADVKLPLLDGVVGPSTVKVLASSCDSTQAGPSGKSTIADVKLGSTAVPVNFHANTHIGIPGIADVIFNEQILLPNGRFSVSALHISLLGGSLSSIGKGDVWLARSICGPATPPVPLASGLGMWIGLGLLGAAAVPVSVMIIRKRRAATTA